MHWLVIQLNNLDYLDQILLALTTADIGPVTVVEAQNLQTMVESSLPVFAGIFPDSGQSQYARILTAPVAQLESYEALLEALRLGGMGPESSTPVGQILLIPVARSQAFGEL